MTLSPDEFPSASYLGGKFSSYPEGWIEWDKNPSKSMDSIRQDLGSEALSNLIAFPASQAPEHVPERDQEVVAA